MLATAAYGLGVDETIGGLHDEAVDDIYLEGLTGLWWQAIEDGQVASSEHLETDHLAVLQSRAMRNALRLEQRLLEVWAALTADGVACRVLKGSAVAHLDYPAPEWRPFNDIDLLVPADHLDHAAAIVESMGGRRLFAEPRPGFACRFAKSVTVRQDDGLEIDLHRTLAEGPYGQTIVASELFEAPESFTLADRPLLALRPEARFVHACVHAVLGRAVPELRPLRDVAQIDRRPDLDHDLVLGLARRWHLEAVVARAVVLAGELPGPQLHRAAWARAHCADRFERRSLPAYHGPRASYRHKTVATLAAIEGTRDRASYLLALLFPDRSYLRDREGTTGRRLRAALGEWRRARTPDPTS